MTDKPKIRHFSDILCVWAYVANIRLEKLAAEFSDQVALSLHYCSVFPDAVGKIETGWKDRGGPAAYGAHVQGVADGFDHITVHPDVWTKTRPHSSTAAHLFLCAARQLDAEAGSGAGPLPGTEYALSWALRQAFFAEGRDVSSWAVQADCAASIGLDPDALRAVIDSGKAAAVLDRDVKLCQSMAINGSPTFVMNDARQTLYGNVGYHLLKANVDEMLRSRGKNEASWC